MRKLLNIIILSIVSGTVALGQGKIAGSDGPFLEALQKRDSVLIGDQLRYGFHLKGVPEGIGLRLPDYSRGFMPGDSVEVVGGWRLDTLKVLGGKKSPKSYDIDFSVLITSFEEGRYTLPPLSIIQESLPGAYDTLVFNPMELEVFTIPVDTATFVLNDIKGQVRYPVTFSEVLPWILALLAVAGLALLARYLVLRRRGKSQESKPSDPPYIVALRRLEKFRDEKYWAKEKQKAFYSGITDTLREYIDSRFGIDAPEMTTAEIFDSLSSEGLPEGLFAETKALFETADLVKFAKAFATDEENAAAVPMAVRFVTSTCQAGETDKEGGKE